MECSVSYFSFNVVICPSLNDAAFNILEICGLDGSLLFNGFSVFDGFLVCVIILSIVSQTGGMVMCFSSIHLTPSKGYADLVFLWLLL